MGFVPKGARWYLADLVREFVIEDDPRNVVHTNTALIEADSPEQAYQKANELGPAEEGEYENTEGKRVRVTFWGLKDLYVIHDHLEHGAELIFDEVIGLPEDQLRRWVKPKQELSVFAPWPDLTEKPDYFPRAVLDILQGKAFSCEGLPGGHDPG